MYNRANLHKDLYAKVPASLWHLRFHGYNYICPKEAIEKREKLIDTDLATWGFLYLNSYMKSIEKGGTGLTDWISARVVSEISKENPYDEDCKPEWSTGTTTRSLQRLRRSYCLIDTHKPTAKRKVKLRNPSTFANRIAIMQEENEHWKQYNEEAAEAEEDFLHNRDKLHRKNLYAKMPVSLWHFRFHGYNYICEKTGELKREKLIDTDLAIWGFLYLNSDMRNNKKGGTGLTGWYSAKMVADASKENPYDEDGKPEWSVGTVKRSIRRLRRAGTLTDSIKPTAKRKSKLRDAAIFPSRKNLIETELQTWEKYLKERKTS